MKCEGSRRHGGAFTLGPVVWVDCEEPPTVMLSIQQDNEVKDLAACDECWNECLMGSNIKVLFSRPLTDEERAKS